MKTKLLSVLFLMASSLIADNPTKSMISLDYHSGIINQTYGSSALNDNHENEKFGIKIGATSDVKRIFLSYREETIYNDTLPDTSGFSFSIEYEGLAAENGSGFFAGLIAGYENYDYMGYDAKVRTQSDFIYGFNIGITLLAADTVGLDIGFRYTLPMDPNSTDYKTMQTATSYVGINYLY